MAVRYELYQNKRTESKQFGKWYARAKMSETTGLDTLAERIQRNCTAKHSDVLAVLKELVEVMQDELQQSHAVRLDGFGTFKIGISTTPADTAADFKANSNVKSLHVNFLPITRIGANKQRKVVFLEGCQVKEANMYFVDKETEAETPVEP